MKLVLLACISIFFFTACSNKANVQQLSADQFEKKLKQTTESYLLDVRTPEEFNSGHIQNAENIDWNGQEFEEKISTLDHSETVFVYCLSGGRSAGAADYLRKAGFKNVYELEGGLLSWRNAGKAETSGTKQQSKGITQSSYNELIDSDKIVIVDFYAPWCAPCKRLEPVLNQISRENKNTVKVIRIDIDQNDALAASMRITEIPFLVYYRNGKKTGSTIGEISKNEILKELNL